MLAIRVKGKGKTRGARAKMLCVVLCGCLLNKSVLNDCNRR